MKSADEWRVTGETDERVPSDGSRIDEGSERVTSERAEIQVSVDGNDLIKRRQ